jgi:hypothetical protein
MRSFAYRQISSVQGVHDYLDTWDVPRLIEATPGIIKVKVPASSLRQVGVLVKCNASPEFSLRLVFEKMTMKERLLSMFS